MLLNKEKDYITKMLSRCPQMDDEAPIDVLIAGFGDTLYSVGLSRTEPLVWGINPNHERFVSAIYRAGGNVPQFSTIDFMVTAHPVSVYRNNAKYPQRFIQALMQVYCRNESSDYAFHYALLVSFDVPERVSPEDAGYWDNIREPLLMTLSTFPLPLLSELFVGMGKHGMLNGHSGEGMIDEVVSLMKNSMPSILTPSNGHEEMLAKAKQYHEELRSIVGGLATLSKLSAKPDVEYAVAEPLFFPKNLLLYATDPSTKLPFCGEEGPKSLVLPN